MADRRGNKETINKPNIARELFEPAAPHKTDLRRIIIRANNNALTPHTLLIINFLNMPGVLLPIRSNSV
jgi:hypothetical protein